MKEEIKTEDEIIIRNIPIVNLKHPIFLAKGTENGNPRPKALMF